MKNLRRLACEFDLDQSEHKSSQVNTSARKAWPNGVASREFASTCDSVWPRLFFLTIEHDEYLTGPLRRRGPGTPQARQSAAASELINKHSLK